VGLRKQLRGPTPAEDGEPSPDIADWLVTPVTVGRDLPPSVSQ